MHGKDFLHLLSFLTLSFQADLTNISETTSLQTTIDCWASILKINHDTYLKMWF